MTRDEVHAVAQGRVWTGRQAKARGLVDELGGLRRAVDLAKERAGIAAGTRGDPGSVPTAPHAVGADPAVGIRLASTVARLARRPRCGNVAALLGAAELVSVGRTAAPAARPRGSDSLPPPPPRSFADAKLPTRFRQAARQAENASSRAARSTSMARRSFTRVM